jgi:hypothetical protein
MKLYTQLNFGGNRSSTSFRGRDICLVRPIPYLSR